MIKTLQEADIGDLVIYDGKVCKVTFMYLFCESKYMDLEHRGELMSTSYHPLRKFRLTISL